MDERVMVNPIEIARNLREYADRGTARGTNHGANDLNAAALIEAQQAEIERLRAVADHLAEVVRQYMDADNWTHDEGFIALADAVDALRAWEETRRG